MMSQEEWSYNSLSSPSSTGGMDQEWPTDSLTNFYVEKLISKTKYPVFTVCSMETGTRYAMKFFPAMKGKVSPFFENEVRFEQCPHPNIITAIKYEYDYELKMDGYPTRGSYILMEYAPFGNFYQVVKSYSQRLDEKIIRTYFHQLIEGIEFLHQMGCAHLDLKPENLLLGADFLLKVADFDTSFVQGDPRILAKGTRFKRAPELLGPKEKIVPQAADIFSAAMILFIFKTGGKIAQAEELLQDSKNLQQLMFNNPQEFWRVHQKMLNVDESFFDQDFKNLFIAMTRENPRARCSIDDIKNSFWYNLPTYSDAELAEKMSEIVNKTPAQEVLSPSLVTKSFFKDPYDMDSLEAQSETPYF